MKIFGLALILAAALGFAAWQFFGKTMNTDLKPEWHLAGIAVAVVLAGLGCELVRRQSKS